MMSVLVPIDLSKESNDVISQVENIVRKNEQKVWLIHVVKPEPDYISYHACQQSERDEIAHKLRKEHQHLQKYAKQLEDSGYDITSLLVKGDTVDKILSESEKLEVDMIIMGSHGHNPIYHLFSKSASKGVLKKSRCPVLIVPPYLTNHSLN